MKEDRTISCSKVLVTGGAGFIGSNLCAALLGNDNEVVCLDNFATGKRENIDSFLENKRFTMIDGDIRSEEDCKLSVQGVDYVLHQGALGSIPRSINDPLTTNEVNISGFLNIMGAARSAKVKRFVYACSSSTYGDHTAMPKVEENIGNPLSPYAVTKYVNELYATVFSNLYDIETIGLRYFNVFGPNQDPDGAYAAAIPRFVKAFINHESPVIYGDGEQSRDFTYVENVVQINQLAAICDNPDAINKVYNVAYGERTSVNELIDMIRMSLATYDPSILEVSATYSEERPGDVKHSWASIDKAKNLLNYQPEYNMKQGLEKAIQWYWETLGGKGAVK
jgi:UDP-N-acetylglucosamine 4-epimerase